MCIEPCVGSSPAKILHVADFWLSEKKKLNFDLHWIQTLEATDILPKTSIFRALYQFT